MQPLVVHVRLMETSYKQAPSSPMRATASFLTTMAPTPICSLLTSELYCVVLDADASFLVAFLDATLTRWSDFFWRILLAYYKSCLISRCWWWWPPSISMGWAFLVWMLEPLCCIPLRLVSRSAARACWTLTRPRSCGSGEHCLKTPDSNVIEKGKHRRWWCGLPSQSSQRERERERESGRQRV